MANAETQKDTELNKSSWQDDLETVEMCIWDANDFGLLVIRLVAK